MKNELLKFKAWSEDTKKFVKVDYLDLLRNGFGVVQPYQSSGGIHWEYPDNLILCQFTGLLDKYGKEIYEGDIIKFEQYYMFDPVPEYKTKTVKIGHAYEHNSEIIGNIHENPELI